MQVVSMPSKIAKKALPQLLVEPGMTHQGVCDTVQARKLCVMQKLLFLASRCTDGWCIGCWLNQQRQEAIRTDGLQASVL